MGKIKIKNKRKTKFSIEQGRYITKQEYSEGEIKRDWGRSKSSHLLMLIQWYYFRLPPWGALWYNNIFMCF